MYHSLKIFLKDEFTFISTISTQSKTTYTRTPFYLMQIFSYDVSVPNRISNSSKKSSTLYKARLLSIFGDKFGAFCMEFGKLFIYSRAQVLVNHRPMSRRFSASGFVSL